MKSSLSCYLTETKMAAWNGCLAAGSFDYASFHKLCRNPTVVGFFLEQAVIPVLVPEELCGGYLGSA